jgi:hypothetical protein
MNLKRGLLRLWVLLALTWLVPTTWLMWNELTKTQHEFLVTFANNKKYSITGPEGASREQALEILHRQLSSKLAELRQKYPEYNDMSDSVLADAIYKKYYSDMPRDQFNDKIGLMEEQVTTVADGPVANWASRRKAIAIILLPPLTVLLLRTGMVNYLKHPLDGCRERARRADEHLAELEREVEAMFEKQAHATPFDLNPNPPHDVIKARLPSETFADAARAEWLVMGFPTFTTGITQGKI